MSENKPPVDQAPPVSGGSSSFKTIAPSLVEYGVYLYLAIMFLSKGEAVRNVLLYGVFAVWLTTLRREHFQGFWSGGVALLAAGYSAVCVLSAVFSIDPAYSFDALRKDLLKGIVIFPVLATHFSDGKKLRGLATAMTVSAALMTLAGFYSYLTTDLPLFKPNIPLMTIWHNKYARYVNAILPFTMVLLIFSTKTWQRVLLALVTGASALGLVLSTSRGGYVAFVVIACVWLFVVVRARKAGAKRIMVISLLALCVLGAVGAVATQKMHWRLASLDTLKLRFGVWEPVLNAAMDRPVIGWGYGSKMVRKDMPYQDTQFDAPTGGTHNTFLLTLFTTGVVGLLSYLVLIAGAMRYCLKGIGTGGVLGFRSFMLTAVLSVLAGNYIFHSMTEHVGAQGLFIILGIAVATGRASDADRDRT